MRIIWLVLVFRVLRRRNWITPENEAIRPPFSRRAVCFAERRAVPRRRFDDGAL
jgi:hypothetical protein